MTNRPPLLALMAAMDLPLGADVPEWVHLLPAGSAIPTFDGRGPYRVTDAAAVIAASMADPRGMLIDVNHATDIAAPKGGDAEAHGWVLQMEARDDGIWANVDWNPSGRALLSNRSYRGISPVIEHLADGTVLRIKRASLTNAPNLKNLTALNMEAPLDLALNVRLAGLLGLAATATDDQIVAAIPAKPDNALQSAMTSTLADIGTALGVDGGNAPALVATIRALQSAVAAAAADKAEIVALKASQKRSASDAWMAGLIAEKVGVPVPDREDLVTLHMENPAQAEKIARLHRNLGPVAMPGKTTASGAPLTALSAEQQGADIAAAARAHQAVEKTKGRDVDLISAIQHIEEQRK